MSFIITKEQNENARQGIIKAAQGKAKSENRLTAMREVEDTATEPEKAFEVCQCRIEKHNGISFLMKNTDCPKHGMYKLNLAFNRPNNSVEGAGRDGRRKVYNSE